MTTRLREETNPLITVNGVVFKRVRGASTLYRNGETWLQYVPEPPGLFGWQASVSDKHGQWCDTPEAALLDLSKRVNSWAKALRELARLNGGAE